MFFINYVPGSSQSPGFDQVQFSNTRNWRQGNPGDQAREEYSNCMQQIFKSEDNRELWSRGTIEHNNTSAQKCLDTRMVMQNGKCYVIINDLRILLVLTC